MGIPSSFSLYAEAFEGIISTKKVLYGPGHYMVDTGLAIGGRGPFIEHEGLLWVPLLDTFFKNMFVLPKLQDLGVDGREVKRFEFFIHV
jgi:hypothetical protein